MALSRSLRRLLRVLEIEEEQRRMELESGLGEVRRLKRAFDAATERGRSGRGLITSGVMRGDLRERLAGLQESRMAGRVETALKPRIAAAESQAAALRQEFLAKRIERRQAEALVEKAEAREADEADRRSQRMLDDRFLSQFHGAARRKTETAERRQDALAEETEA